MESYFDEWREALQDIKADGMPVKLTLKGEDERDQHGRPIGVGEDKIFLGHGLTVNFSAYHMANNLARSGDVRLIFVSETQSADYLAFVEKLNAGNAQVKAEFAGQSWQVLSNRDKKPTTTQIVMELHLRR